MAQALILRDIHLTFGGTPLLEGADLFLAEGERVALVGRNGSGKSTLLKIAEGSVIADAGERFVQPGLTVRYLPQEPDLSGHASTLDYVMAGLTEGDDPHRARRLLERLGLSGAEDPARLSGGEARRAAIVRVLAPEPDIVLLDEPTNHLDLPTIEWLEDELARMRGALVTISHDRRFLNRLSRATVWIAEGRTRRLEQGFEAFEAWRDEQVEHDERERHKLERKIARETEWLHRGVTARRKRNQGRLRALQELRTERRDRREAQGAVAFTVTGGDVTGRLVVEAKGVAKAFDGRAIVRDFSLRVQRADRIGIVGPNGAGKTTLLKLLTGSLAPDAGTVRLGSNLQMAVLDQGRDSIDPATPLKVALTGGAGDTVSVGGETKHVIGYMKDFLFLPEQAETPVGALSGGERARVVLARALAKPSNVLVLDEPTNDLDIETLDLLQEVIADYAGTVILISHDRDFLDRTVTLTVASEGGGLWTVYGGGYSDMAAQRALNGKAEAAPEPRKAAGGGRESAERAKRPAPQKLSFNESHALKTLPARMAALEAEIGRLRETLADGGLFGRDPAAFKTAARQLEEAEAALKQAEDQWLMLELKREAIDRG